MESSAGTIAPPPPAPPPDRPGWVWTAAWVSLAAIVTAIPLEFGLAGVASLQLIPEEGWDGTKGGPWPIDGAWALAADAGWGLLFGFALAYGMRVAVRGWSDSWDVRLWPIACATALAITSPGISGLGSLALVVIVTRQHALRPAAAAPRSRRVAAAIAAGTAALLVATFTYQPFHPLLAAFPGHRNQLMPNDYGFGSSRHSPARAVRFQLENAGFGTVMVRSLHVVGPNARLLRIEGLESLPTGHPLDRNSSLGGRVWLSKAACATDAARYRIPSASVDALVVQVETLGLVRTQRFELKPSADLFCGSAR